MLRSKWFYGIQLICHLTLLVVTSLNLVMNMNQVENIFVTETANAINATSQYIFIIFFNALILFKLVTEFFPGYKFTEFKAELYSTRLLRNITSLLSFGIGMIVLGNMLSLCGLCDWAFVVIPIVAFISDVVNNDEDLISIQGERTLIERWFNPAYLSRRSFWLILLLYIMNLGALAWGFIAYYLQNTDKNKSLFEEKNCHIIYYTATLMLLLRFIIFSIGRWWKPDDRSPLSSSYSRIANNNDEEAAEPSDRGLVTFGSAINAPVWTYLIDMAVFASISVLIGTLETLTFEYTNKRYIILLNDLSFILMIMKLVIGKNKV